MLLLAVFGYSQVTNEGKPLSWSVKDIASVEAVKMSGFDLAKLEAEDRINDAGKNKSWRYGFEFLVDHNLDNSGSWTTLANGDRVWRIRYYSEGAHTLNFLFSDYYMPRGAKVYLYNNDRSDLLGAYDAAQNNEKRELGTWLVTGDDIWIEYYEPAEVKGQGKLEIFKVVHGYRSVGNFKSPESDLNSSGNCHYDVNCSIPGIDDLKEINKKAVGLIIVSNSSFCSGALINNTANDGTPYFLTANHCSTDNDFSQWAFRFNWVSPLAVCAQNTNSIGGADYYQTMSGAELKARRAASDFCLVELTNDIPEDWDVVFAGWNRNEVAPASTFGIHHPSGDVMKVSMDTDEPSLDNSNNEFMWYLQSWDYGVTEGGSSGSPLFDMDGRIIGQLYGGESQCIGKNGNGGYDVYGRIGKSWNAGNSASSRLKDWLDPGNSNVQTLDYKSVLSAENFTAEKLKVYPNPSKGVFAINLASAAEYSVYSVLGQQVAQGQLNEGENNVDISASANGIYIMKVTDASGKTASYKLVKE